MKILKIISQLLSAIFCKPSDEMSRAWAEQELENYEHETEKAAGLF